MKSKSTNEVVKTDSPALTAVISYWKEFDKKTVILSYLELQRRKFNLDVNIQKKLNSFAEKQGKSIEELVNEYKEDDDFKNYEQYAETLKIEAEKENEKKRIIEAEKLEKNKNKTIFTPLNICLFLGLCIGCYLPIKYLIQSADNTPKCSSPEVVNTVMEMFRQNGNVIDNEKTLENIMTISKDEELETCDCEATLPGNFRKHISGFNYDNWDNPTIYYKAQRNEKGEIVVSVTSPF